MTPRRAPLLALAALTLASPCLAQSSVTYSYDALGRVKAATHARTGAPTQVTTYAYDAADNRRRVHVGPPGTANRAPSCTARTKNVGELVTSTTVNPVSHVPACSDADGDRITLVSAGGWTDGASGSVNLSTGIVTVASLEPGVTHRFTFTVTDGTAQRTFYFYVKRASACEFCRSDAVEGGAETEAEPPVGAPEAGSR